MYAIWLVLLIFIVIFFMFSCCSKIVILGTKQRYMITQEEEDKSPSSISLNSENNIQDSSEESIDNFENAVTTHNLNIQTTNEAANSLKNNNVEEDIEIKTINNGPKIDTKLDKKNILITLGNISELLIDSEEFTEKWREKLT